MKLKNIKVGEWVIYKLLGELMHVRGITNFGRINALSQNGWAFGLEPKDVRKPRISDLSIGSSFQVKTDNGWHQFTLGKRVSNTYFATPYGEKFQCQFDRRTKVKVIYPAEICPHAASPAQNQTSNI